jgi:hypothetical protein
MKPKIKIEKRIHKGWEEWHEKMPDDLKIKSMFGKAGWAWKYQYIYSSEKGEISLVRLKVGGMKKPFWMWEILELSDNNLFEDVERFIYKKDAIAKIKSYLK